ncbi:hypothetical protein T492DRAFT_894619, partial [Pavlovales sp. CCMP2436]
SSSVLKIISAVLHLGCAQFELAVGGADGSRVIGGEAMSSLLLERRLTIAGLKEELVIKLTPAQLAFLWLVRAMNRSMWGAEGGGDMPFIGMLDVFGFEDFAVNNFEQYF